MADEIENEEKEDKLLDKLLNLRDDSGIDVKNLKKDELSTLYNQITTWRKEYIEENYLTKDHIFKDFEVSSRNLIISGKLRIVLIQREEEILASINEARKTIDNFDKETKDIPEREVQKRYTNAQLIEITQIRSQVLPNLFVELENLVTAINNNEAIYENCKTNIDFVIDNTLSRIEYLQTNNGE
jgi:hypothetical protein